LDAGNDLKVLAIYEQQFACQANTTPGGGVSMHSHRMFKTVLSITRRLLAGASVPVALLFAGPSLADNDARPVKVMIINMFGGTAFPLSEASAFTGNLGL
jgi:hypothetical protein